MEGEWQWAPNHAAAISSETNNGTMEPAQGGAIVPSLWVAAWLALPPPASYQITMTKSSWCYIYDVVSQAEPIGEAQATRFPASVRRRYEGLRRFPEGYLILGDAVSSFNPAYGQGMSVAALEAVELDKALRGGSTNLARRFFAQIARIVDVPWSIAAGNDLRMPGVTGPRTPMTRFFNGYVAKVHLAAQHDSSVALAFHKVASLLVPPQSLFKPSVIARVLSASFSYRPVLNARTAPTVQAA